MPQTREQERSSYQEKRRSGRCVQCGLQHGEPQSHCPVCRNQRNKAQRSRQRASALSATAKGLCQRCLKPALRGLRHCETHRRRVNIWSAIRARKKSTGVDNPLYLTLVARQQGRCGICQKPAKYVDHDHITKQVRGILCNRCNLGLGHFNDDPVLLYAALQWVIGDRHVQRQIAT